MSLLALRIWRLVLAPAFCLLCAVTTAVASPAEELEEARDTFLAGDFESAVGRFSALLYPTSRLADESLIAESHLLLGVSYFETKQRDSAKREFEEALFLDATLRLDASIFSAEVIPFFNGIRTDIERKAKTAAESEQLARKQQALDRALRNLVVLEKRRYWVNFVPFGAGQFQNGQSRKGFAFFAAEALAGGTAVGLWSYQVIKYGFRGKVPRDEVSTVNTLQVLQIGSGALFYALLAWGIVDSLSNYEHVVTREADPSLIKDLEDIYDIKPTASIRVFPTLTGDYGGVLMQWEF
ncbi:MAG: hypothetical protein GY811_12835 [Myxococcales bacterium]|nr:hypothetical protein [Myxococcales bacterium]